MPPPLTPHHRPSPPPAVSIARKKSLWSRRQRSPWSVTKPTPLFPPSIIHADASPAPFPLWSSSLSRPPSSLIQTPLRLHLCLSCRHYIPFGLLAANAAKSTALRPPPLPLLSEDSPPRRYGVRQRLTDGVRAAMREWQWRGGLAVRLIMLI